MSDPATIVVGYVPTPEGLAAVEYAVTQAQRDDARLVVVNSGVRGYDSDPAFASAADLDALATRLTDLGVAHEIRQAAQAISPAEEILQAATDVGADLIVIGLRRRSPVGKLFLGSSSQQVILDAACPVVAVKRPD
ncbi:universal stress protein [Nocardioides hankookensis]|uniref:Universal stress protein n=1 Tax=Nocardioides hankookensis TaxID=443157 RepID=A0ABW1LIA9_9ACTN